MEYPYNYPFAKKRFDTQLITPLAIAPAIKMPMEGINKGSQRLYHRSNPRLMWAACPAKAVANQPKLRSTKKRLMTKTVFSQLIKRSFIYATRNG